MAEKKKKSGIKKNIRMFLNSEEGKMLDADIVKTGIALGIIGGAMADQASAAIHSNYFTSNAHVSHQSHGSHGSHSRGGWC